MTRSPSRSYRDRLRQAGFTLIELMIVVAVMSILAAIAYPSYISHITKTHRVAAEGCLAEFSNYMERSYTTNLYYPASASTIFTSMDCATTSQTGNDYQYNFASASSTAYVLQATPINTQASRDTKCGTLTLNQSGTRTVSGTGTLSECW